MFLKNFKQTTNYFIRKFKFLLYFYGTKEERPEFFKEIENYCKENGFDVDITNIKRYSGYNKYDAVRVKFGINPNE